MDAMRDNPLLDFSGLPRFDAISPEHIGPAIDALGGVDTIAGLVSTEIVSVWGVFMMRQFFLSLPRETEDAARIDGASEWTIFWRIALPLARPAMAT